MKQLNRNKNYHQGYFVPKNIDKYKGNLSDGIIYRSSWEQKFMTYCDLHPSIVYWSSETAVIPYLNPIDNKIHKYFVDFWIMTNNKNDGIKKYLVEIKPSNQLVKPKPLIEGKKYKKSQLKSFEWAMVEYIKNSAKWEAATQFCKQYDMKFIVITEKQLKDF